MNHQCERQQLKIWYCENCGQVHLKAEQTLLSFTRTEFADFTDAVVEIHCQGWWKPGGRVGEIERTRTDQILSSETVA